MSRTPQEVFQHHAEVLVAEDIDGIVSDYSDDAVFITKDGVLRGKDGVREAFTDLLGHIPQAAWDIKSAVYEGEHMLLHWSAESENTQVDDGVDTFMFQDGLIVMQTVNATYTPKG
jgi:predicted SnoaL-like aldol condensation-catalyzing enzyme